MVALALFGMAAATMTDFDLAATRATSSHALASPALLAPRHARSPYLLPRLQDQDAASEGSGVRVKLRWRKVKLTVPFGPN